MYNEALILIEDRCLAIVHKPLAQLGMTSPNRLLNDILDSELQREQCFDINGLKVFVQSNI
jgi:hypothetical protein